MGKINVFNAEDALGMWVWVPIKGTSLYYGGELERDDIGIYMMSGKERIDIEDGTELYLEGIGRKVRLRCPK